jgi:hypothetical protein
MPTKQSLLERIAELENWLTENPPEHESRPIIETDLRELKTKLEHIDYEDYN